MGAIPEAVYAGRLGLVSGRTRRSWLGLAIRIADPNHDHDHDPALQ